MGRREFFGSFLAKARGAEEGPYAPRPPYGQSESLFQTECAQCEGSCAAMCEEGIIITGEDGTPRLDFAKGGCTFCRECAKACEYGVLLPESEKSDSIEAEFGIDVGSCMAWSGVICYSCKDACDEGAISFLGMMRPSIAKERCIGCGFCYYRCPADAIGIRGVACA